MLERASFERREIENIMGLPQGGLFGIVRDKVQDRVACDLGVPFHKVELPHYKDWKGRGFKADPEEFKLENISEEERQRLQDLATGCALRK